MSTAVADPLETVASSLAATSDRSFWIRLLTTTFLGAFLLFQVQPLIGKAVLPWYGGTPAVWTTALLFFQLMLVAGYALAYLSVTFLSPTLRSYVFMALSLGAVLLLPIGADARWKPTAADEPIAHMLGLLLACVGGPYLVLASTAPTTQEWFTRSGTQRSPYRLYALSNLGSLLGLLTYPFVVERYFDATMQARLWSGAFALFALLAASCAWNMRDKHERATTTTEPDPARNPEALAADRISLGRLATWIGLAAAGTVLLMSSTYHLCQDIASVPFLWVAPLVAYLLTFIIAFDHARWYRRTWYCAASVVLVPLACLQGVTFTALQRSKVWAAAYLLPLRDVSFGVQAAIVLGMLFATCMLCHGELAARKPSPRRLTLYFLAIAVGGALGGIFTAVVAPLIFDRNWEWMLATLAALGFALAGIYNELRRRKLLETSIHRAGAGVVGFAGIALLCWLHFLLFNENELVSARNFYGVVSVDVGRESETDRPIYKSMRSGTTFHGLQLTDEPFRRHASAYYSAPSGVGLALVAAGENTYPLRVGIIGLGAGTLGVYGRPGDKYDFFEINPVVIRFADEHFSFLRDSAAECRVVEGDARLSLEREAGDAGKQYDLLVLDAFSGDSIPTHLLTVEAFELYLKRLSPDGIVAVHLSNRYLDLIPVVAAAAKQLGLAGMWSVNKPDPATYVQPARWALLERTPNSPTWTTLKQLGFTDLAKSREVRLWTDGYSNLFEILK